MEALCVNNITVNPGKKPAKDLILAELKQNSDDEWINIFVTKCRNIYYLCSKNHPIAKYEKKPLLLLIHLFYILNNLSISINPESTEYRILASFLYGLFNHIRPMARESYRESLDEPLVEKFFNDYCIVSNVCTFSISKIENQLKSVKDDSLKLKADAINIFSQMEKEIQKVSKIVGNLKVPEKTQMQDSSSQTDPENVWKTKSFLSKSKKDSSTQIDAIQKINSDTQTYSEISIESAPPETKSAPESKKKKKGKGKNDEDIITFTANEYFDLMQKHQNEILKTDEKIKKAEQESLTKFRNNISEIIKENPITGKMLFDIIDVCENVKVIDAVVVWSMKMANQYFYDGLMKSGIDPLSTRVLILPFYDFWEILIMPNIDKFPGKIFKKMKMEWLDFMKTFKGCFPLSQKMEFDVAFTNFSTNIIFNLVERQCFMPPFFNLLLGACRSVRILNGLIRKFALDYSNKNLDVKETLIEFEMLFASPSAQQLLYKNRKNIEVDYDFQRIIFNLDSEEEVV